MVWPGFEGRYIDLEEFDGRLDQLIAVVRDEPGQIAYRRDGEVTASSGVSSGTVSFEFYYDRWGRQRDHLMGSLTLALVGEDLDEVETGIANAVAEARREIWAEREARSG